MKKLASTLPFMLLSLTGICCVAAALLATVYEVTYDTIKAQELESLQSGIGKVTPPFDNEPYEERVEITLGSDNFIIYPAKKAGRLVGVAVETMSHKGFSGDIRILVGMDSKSTIVDYTVLQQSETPGLGAEMQTFFREAGTRHNVLGLSLVSPLVVSKDGGEVDGITAATISSRAFLDALNKAQEAYKKAIEEEKILQI